MRKLLVILTILLYICVGCFIWMTIATAITPADSNEQAQYLAINVPFYTGVSFSILTFIYAIFCMCYVFFSKKEPLPYSFILTIKLVLIPYYLANFVLWFIYTVGFTLISAIFTPIFTPIVIGAFIGISLVFTYVVMLTTSSFNLKHLAVDFKNKSLPLPRTSALVYTILHFFFCLDVFASIGLALAEKRNKKTEIDNSATN